MAQSSSSVLLAHGEAAVHIVTTATGVMQRLARQRRSPLSREAKRRLAWFTWHACHGQNVSRTARHFGISRQTFYRWHQRYDPRDLRTLEDRPSRPKKRRRPTWTAAQVAAVQALRERYPCWGKDKLAVLLERQGMVLAVSMVGRILAYLKRTGQLREPVRLRRIRARQRGWRRPYAVRKPKDWRVSVPGDLVQLDTLDVRPEPGVVLKQFTAHDVVSRWNGLEVASRATATTAVRALAAVLARLPFAVKALQVDGGSEFMAEFEAACQAQGIRLFALPPRSPKLNGGVERAQRTHGEEFYACTEAEPTVAALAADLRAWEDVYNTVRPHQALGYRTPWEAVQAWQAEASDKAGVSCR